MHFKNEEDYKKWAETQDDDALGGGLFTPDGPENYVGAVSAIRAVLYFKEGYSDEMREAIALCFDDYQKIQPWLISAVVISIFILLLTCISKIN